VGEGNFVNGRRLVFLWQGLSAAKRVRVTPRLISSLAAASSSVSRPANLLFLRDRQNRRLRAKAGWLAANSD
jgi:hypothetical protein